MAGKHALKCGCIFLLVLGVRSYDLNGGNINNKHLFNEVARIELKFNDVVFASIIEVVPVNDGFVLIINESRFGDTYSLLKISKNGNLIDKYDKRGNGPGEIRSIDRIAIKGKSILAAERFAPFIHEFSNSLEFIKDYRLKRGGNSYLLGEFIGIWSTNSIKEGNKDKNYILALYDSNTLEFKKYAFEISKIPLFVYGWGGICKVDNQNYAGIYSTEYQIYIFDRDFQLKKKLINIVPEHIKKYYPYKKNPQIFNEESQKWMESWSKMHSIYFVEGKFILRYTRDNINYLDIISREGNILEFKFVENKRWIVFTENSYIWWLEKFEDNDDMKFTLIKSKLDLK